MARIASVLLFALSLIGLTAASAPASLVINSLGDSATIDFDNTVAGVNSGTLNVSNNAGYAPSPAVGQLDSDAFAVDVGSADIPANGTGGANAVGFGGTLTTGGNAMNQTTATTFADPGSGLYPTTAHDSGNSGVGIRFQMEGSQLTPGTLFLKVTNSTGGTIDEIDFGFDFYSGTAGEPGSFSIDYAAGADVVPGGSSTWTNIDTISWTGAANSAAGTDFSPGVYNLTGLGLADGEELVFRWLIDGGFGSRPDPILDNITVSTIPEPASLALIGLGGLAMIGRPRRRTA